MARDTKVARQINDAIDLLTDRWFDILRQDVDQPAERQNRSLIDLARGYQQIWQTRHAAFAAIENEYAWNIILDLFLAAHDGRSVSMTKACAVSGAPVTSALRYVRALEAGGMISRLDRENRRVDLSLTEQGDRAAEAFLRSLSTL